MAEKEVDVVDTYYNLIGIAINKHGVYPQHLILIDKHDKMLLMSLDLSVSQCISAMVASFREGPKKLIMGLDRMCMPNQGTTLGDCIAGFYWNGEKWATFVIEYQNEPRIVKPIEWNNPWWNSVLTKELKTFGFEV